jgi:predicted DNA-binding protein (MmcQ/YjbR family)
MNVEEIREYCLAFPDVTENLQWGDDLCFKIRGKIFVTMALTAVPQKVCFKCTPETFVELIEREEIRPAPYVGRYNWVILERLDALRRDDMEDLIRQSYEMVAERAPKSRPGRAKGTTSGRKRKMRKRKIGARARKTRIRKTPRQE